MDLVEIIVSVIGTVGLLAGSISLYRSNVKVKQIEARSAPYDEVVDRVVDLEKSDREKHREIMSLRTDLSDKDEVIEQMSRELRQVQAEAEHRDQITRTMAAFIDEFGTWWAQGQQGRPPRPSRRIHDYIQTSLWDTDPTTPRITDHREP